MNEHEAQTDSQSCEVVGGSVGLRRGTKHDENEYAGEHNLSQQTADGRYSELKVIGSRAGY